MATPLHPPIVCIVGRSGAGKTLFLERLIPAFEALGLRSAVIKHGHDFDLDRPGKDSWRLARAGATTVVLSSPNQVALLESIDAEWPAGRLAALTLGRADMVLAEGYKFGPHPKIEVVREALGPPLCPPEQLWAVISPKPVAGFQGVAHFGPQDALGVAAMVGRAFGCLPLQRVRLAAG